MGNITLAIEDEIIRKVRKMAIEKNTTLTAMVRETLSQLAAREDFKTEEIISELEESFNSGAVKVSNKDWKREDLYDR